MTRPSTFYEHRRRTELVPHWDRYAVPPHSARRSGLDGSRRRIAHAVQRFPPRGDEVALRNADGRFAFARIKYETAPGASTTTVCLHGRTATCLQLAANQAEGWLWIMRGHQPQRTGR